MTKRVASLILLAAIFLGGLSLAVAGRASAQDPTIPTRTPTPDPDAPVSPVDPGEQPTDEPPDNGGPDPQPTGTDTPVPDNAGGLLPTVTNMPQSGSSLATATATPIGSGVTGIIGPVSAGVDTEIVVPGPDGPVNLGLAAGACTALPFIQAPVRLTVVAGPGADYEPVGNLLRNEIRLIIGRAANAPWWQIQFSDTEVAWVADVSVLVFGNTVDVPVVMPPNINGEPPTPGAAWNPTPMVDADCVATPTATPTSTATPVAASDAPTAVAGMGSTGAIVSADIPEQTQAELTAGDQTGAGAASGSGSQEAQSAGSGLESRGSGASSVRDTSTTSSINLFLPIAGVLLIGAGIVLAMLSRGGAAKPTGGSTPNE